MSEKSNQELLVEKQYITPAIVGWNRLEPRPRTADFQRSLKAEVRDALWMLSRQWQIGEFRGEDAGSPIDARILTTENVVNQYAAKTENALPLDDSIPLETLVERESLPDSLKLKIQISTQFFKIISRLVPQSAYTSLLKKKYPVLLPVSAEDVNKILCNQPSYQVFEQARMRSIDGYKLISEIRSGEFNEWVGSLPETKIAGPDKTVIINAGQTLLQWFARLYNQPGSSSENAWTTAYLEYQFACSAATRTAKEIVLNSEQYASGHLSWYSFDVDKSKQRLPVKNSTDDVKERQKVISFIPAPASFGGMPSPRYWEMEEQKTDPGAIDANTTDVAKLIVAEFALIYSNDWFIFPYSMPRGSLCTINGMIITDTFGDQLFVRAAGNKPGDNWQTWRLFNMSVTSGEADTRLMLCPSAVKILQSEPVEKVNFIRDEMANSVWAIESIICLPSGSSKNGFEAATELSSLLSAGLANVITELDATVKYSLGSTVPENWIPFIPVHVDGSNREVQLQRAAMPRVSDSSNALIRPRTTLISGNPPFYIHEEEVPRSGTILTKSFKRTRWYNGKVALWLGRTVTNGKGEATSGLNFDQVKKI